jgi:hypothetical protein
VGAPGRLKATPRGPIIEGRAPFARSVPSRKETPPVTEATLVPLPTERLGRAERLLLTPANLNLDVISRVLRDIHAHDVDFADFYFQHSSFESWSLEEGIVKAGTFNIDSGVGVRAVSGDKQAFAYSDDISLAALEEAAQAVRAIGRQGQSACAPIARHGQTRLLYPSADPVTSLADAEKVAVLTRLEQRARALDPRVVQVMASLAGEHETVLIARSDGMLAADVRPLSRISITVIVEENGRREQGYAGGGGRFDYAYFDEAILDDYDSAEDAPIVFSGEGWIPGDRLGLLLNRGNLMAGPDVNAPIVARLFSDAEGAGPDSFNVTGLRSCVGRWVEVEGDFLGTHLHGWNASTCSNQVTTCP